jgi:Rps23 Pro-64 3,4-dihydroxylase Tpa1-like proline 4-hydroxylase
MPVCIKKLFHLLSCEEITQKISSLSDIFNLEYDPYLHGAGLHIHPKDGKLDMHLDYEKHPHMDKQRRLNIILYMSKDWQNEWNGETQLWDKNLTKCVVKSPVVFNTAIIFKTNETSWHGLPEPIACPANVLRKSIAYYYVSPMESTPEDSKVGNDGTGYRTKATFKKRPDDLYDELKAKLYKIRPFRLITKEDLL